MTRILIASDLKDDKHLITITIITVAKLNAFDILKPSREAFYFGII